jgi:putative DNA primase/helicase
MIKEFKNAMLEQGLVTPDYIIADGKIHRYKKSIWYVFHNEWGVFGDWKTGVRQVWHPAKEYDPPSKEQIKEQKRQSELRKTLEKEKQNKAAGEAVIIWKLCKPTKEHPYLIRKGIKPYCAEINTDGRLVVPMFDIKNNLVNLQFINSDGQKRFLKGCKKQGCFCPLVEMDDKDIIMICEGFATGASLQEHFGHYTVVAFDAGNLTPVAVNIRLLYPDSRIIICGDYDISGVGQKAAQKAADACHGIMLLPSTIGNDWNDELS